MSGTADFDIRGLQDEPKEPTAPAAPPVEPTVEQPVDVRSDPTDYANLNAGHTSVPRSTSLAPWAGNVARRAFAPEQPKAPAEEKEPWEIAANEDEPWNVYNGQTQSKGFNPYQAVEGLSFDATGQPFDIDRPEGYAGYETINNIVGAFPAAAHAAAHAYKESAIIPDNFFELSQKTKDALKDWSEYSDVEKQQAGLLQAFNAATVYPAVRALAQASLTFVTLPLSVAQDVLVRVPAAGIGGLEAGLAEFGERQWPNTGIGRKMAGVVEMGVAEVMGRAGMHARPAPIDNGLRMLKTDTGVLPVVLKEPVGAGELLARVEDAQGQIRFVPPEDLAPPITPEALQFAAQSGLTGDKNFLTPEQVAAATEVRDLTTHDVVRNDNPALFDAYDPLMAERDKLRADLAAREAELRDRAEMNAAENASEEAIAADHEARMAEDAQIANWTDRLRTVDEKLAEFEPEVREAYKRAAPGEAAPEATTAGAEVPEAPIAPSTTNITDHVAERLLKAWEDAKREGTPEQFAQEARAGGALVEAFFQTLSERFGGRKGTAAQLYDRLGPEITGVRVLGPGGTAGGSTTFNAKTLGHVIKLARRSDASTFAHELAHMMTNLMFRAAENPLVSEGLRNDVATLQKWVKSQPGRMLTTAQHERVALGFEKYLSEGRAPTRELAGVFAQFRDWLKNVYEQFRQKNVPISDDIRRVFDRWLTSAPEAHEVAVAPENLGPPPRPRSRNQILQQWSLEGKDANSRAAVRAAQQQSDAEFIALADWQEARRKKGLTTVAEREAEPIVEPPPEPLAETPPEAPVAETAPTETSPVEAAAAAREATAIAETPTEEPATRRVPKKPKSLRQWLEDTGGISENHPEIAKSDLYNDEGRSLEQAAVEAQEAGYFNELGGHKADAAELLDAIKQENEGAPIYASQDAAAVKAFNDAVLHNAKIAELAEKHGVASAGKTLEAFLAEVKEKIGDEAYAREIAAQETDALSKGAETRENADNVGSKAAEEVDGASEPNLEALWKAANEEGAARQLDVGTEDGVGRESTTGGTGAGEANMGGERGGAGDTGRTDQSGGKRGPLSESEPGDGLKASIKAKDRADMEKVGNIRWDYFDNDLFALARDTMAKLGWFPDNAGPTEGVFRARATSVLMNKAWEELQTAKAKFLASPTGESGIAIIKAQQNAAKATMVQSEMLADWGKTGNALRDILKVNRARIAEIQRLGDLSEKTLFQIQEQMSLADTLPNIDQYNRFMMDVNTTRYQKARNGILSFYINNLLSNPITHTAYLMGNEIGGLFKVTAEAAAQAGVGIVRQGVLSALGREVSAADRVHIGEIRAALHGQWTGTMVGLRAAGNAIKTGEMLMQGLSDRPSPRQQAIFGMIGIKPEDALGYQKSLNWIGYGLETPTRMIQAIHVFSYARAYGAELGRLAYHDAILKVGEGAKAEEIGAAIQKFYNSVPDDARASAHDEALRTVLMRSPTRETAVGRALIAVNSAVNNNIVAKMLFPFNQIGLNLATEGVGRRSILALAMPDVRADLSGANGGRAFDLAAGRIVAGSAIAGGIITMSMLGLVTGPGPSRETQAGRNFARVREDEGIANDAFQIGNVFVPYMKVLGPIGQLMSLAVSFKDSAAYMTEGEKQEAAINLAHGFGHAVVDDTAFRTLHDIHEAIIGSRAGFGSGIGPYLSNVASNFLPLSSFMNAGARQIDLYRRRSDNLLEAVQKKIPFASESLPESVGPWGTGVISHTTMGIHMRQNDPVNQAFIRMGMGPAPIPHKINGMDMDTREYEQYGHIAGTIAHQMLLPMVTQPGFEQIPPGQRMEIMNAMVSVGRASAQAQIVALNPGKFIQEAQALQLKMLTEGKTPGGTPAMRQ